MVNVYIATAKYLMLILMAFYTYTGFYVLGKKKGKSLNAAYSLQVAILFVMHFIGYSVIYLNVENDTIILFYGLQVVYFILVIGITNIIYEKQISRAVLNNMCLMLAIGMIVITRLSYTKAVKQFSILVAATIVSMIVPKLIIKMKNLRNLTWVYCVSGIVMLLAVMIVGSVSYGAKLSIEAFGVSFQLSELVKLLYVFFLAALLHKSSGFKGFILSALFAGIHVIILVCSRDLGSALIFFVVYLAMIYVSTGKAILLFSGLLAGSGAAVVAYKLFAHIRVRIVAYTNPWKVIDNEGYQITQSLFAIGTGGWLGLGLCKGTPNKVPVVDQDFVISAISEELGGFFALCLMVLCMCTFLAFIKIASEQPDIFYKLIALGLAITYGFQTILTIGGAIKFIPSTGVTLPLVSYGGSSLFTTMILFGIFQGINGLRKKPASEVK